MKKTIKMSIVSATFLLAQGLYADASSLEEAFKNGSVSGDITLYAEQVNNSGVTPDSGFTMGSIGLGYETDSYNGLKLALGFRTNHNFSEKEDGDYSNGTEPRSILGVANISYTNNMFGLTVGRQEIDLEWIGDFHEAIVGSLNVLPDTTIVVGYTDRMTAVDPDAPLADFAKVNGDDGATLGHVIYEGIDGLVLQGYYYTAKNVANWYGVKAEYDIEQFGITAHHAKSSEDTVGADDGDVSHLELRGNVADIALSGGYITTDKTGAIGSMDTLGDNINPLEEGNQVYTADADTYYVGLGYEIDALSLGAMYGKTDYGTNADEREINLIAEYGFNDNTSAGLVFVDVSANNSADDYSKVAVTLSYSF